MVSSGVSSTVSGVSSVISSGVSSVVSRTVRGYIIRGLIVRLAAGRKGRIESGLGGMREVMSEWRRAMSEGIVDGGLGGV